MELPSWLNEENPRINCSSRGGQRRSTFIAKTLNDIVDFLHKSVFSESIARQKGFLQNLDSRIKVLIVFYLLLVVNLCSNLLVLWSFYGGLLIVVFLSKLPLRQVLSRVWLVIPIFSGIMIFPSLFSWVREGEPLWVIWRFQSPLHLGGLNLPPVLSVTRQGVAGGALLISRVGISVSLAVVLTLSTRWNNILRALRFFFVPQIFVAALEMTYRYIYVLIQAMEEIFFARKARDAGHSTSKEQRRFIAAAMGGLFGKSMQMSDEVYSAMTARGYMGEVRVLYQDRIDWQDLLIMVLVILAGLIMIAANNVL